MKTLNEVALRAYWSVFKGAQERRQVVALTNEVKKRIPSDYRRPPITRIDNINSEEGREKLRELKPDVCVLMLHPLLGEKNCHHSAAGDAGVSSRSNSGIPRSACRVLGDDAE